MRSIPQPRQRMSLSPRNPLHQTQAVDRQLQPEILYIGNTCLSNSKLFYKLDQIKLTLQVHLCFSSVSYILQNQMIIYNLISMFNMNLRKLKIVLIL